MSNEQEIEQLIETYLKANLAGTGLDYESIEVEAVVTETFNSRTIRITANTEVKTAFLPLFQIDSIAINVSASAYQAIPNLELAMVLDVSSSMRGNRISNLKSASKEFVDEMLTDDTVASTSLSIIPFGGTVNIGSLFDTYVVPLSTAAIDPSEADYAIGSDVNSGSFRFTDGDQCIEYVQADYDDELIPSGSRGQLPHFWRWNNFNPWCPTSESTVMFNRNNTGELKTHLEGMTLSDGTGMDVGALWGLKSLSPDYKGFLGGDFSDRPAQYNAEDSKKVLVIMTDGGITEQDRPEDYLRYNTHTNRSSNNTDLGNGSGNQGNNANKQVILSRGNASHSASKDNAVGRFKKICDAAHDEGIVVYTIGFQIQSNSLPDDMLKYCASSPGNYYHVESLDISVAFQAIATSVKALHITE